MRDAVGGGRLRTGMPPLRTVTATRYVTPLREGGSLPGLMEADDLGTYVVKWRAAGQGVKVLVAEVICGELARRPSDVERMAQHIATNACFLKTLPQHDRPP